MPKRKRSRVRTKTRSKKAKEKKESWEEYLTRIYFDPRHPGSFKGPNKLYEVVKEEGKHSLGLSKIRKWLNDQPAYSLNKAVRRKFPRLKVIVTGIHDQYEADLADMQKLKTANDGYTFILIVIDVFSRYIWVEPLKRKTEEDVMAGLKMIFRRAEKPRRMRTDRGKEFTGRKMLSYWKRNNIEFWTAHNDEMKASYAESAVRSVKRSLWSYMKKNNTYRYIDVLQDVVHSYNNTRHRKTGMKPVDITRGDTESAVWWHTYKPDKGYHRSRLEEKINYKFHTGDHVRISHKVQTFERAYDEKWTREIFLVKQPFTRFGIRKYRLTDLTGEPVMGTFYEGELQKVKYDEKSSFDVEKVLRTRGTGGRKESLVKWKGWPDKFNSWVPDKLLIQHNIQEPVTTPT